MQVQSVSTCGNLKIVTVQDSLWKKQSKHRYTVENDKFDEFSSELQKESISWKKKTKAAMISGIAAGGILGALASKNASGAVQALSTVLCAAAGAALSALSLSQIFDIKHRTLLVKFNAQPAIDTKNS